MTAPILVTGGTGTLGRQVVPRLVEADRRVRVLSRHDYDHPEGVEPATGDLTTGEGIEAAVAGTEVVLHLAGTAKGDESRPASWSGRPPRPECGTWSSSRSSGPTGSR